jgi:virulence-associated protein VapD
LPFDNQGEPFNRKRLFGSGVVVSFDFIIEQLRHYYSETSPQGAYAVIERAFVKQGFEKLKDSDYKHDSISEAKALKIVADFAKQEKWFPVCINKVIISPNVPSLDISENIKAFYTDDEWKQKKDEEYAARHTDMTKEHPYVL